MPEIFGHLNLLPYLFLHLFKSRWVRGVGNLEIFLAGTTLNTLLIHIISRLTKHIYSYNLHVKRYRVHIIEEY